ncbi:MULTISPECIES: hypothetical protein [unclassified Sphingobacterium]|uniref:hypothetical protein n=1 Tax=unclassified Sphingobacterium TaxID=2609468 RepID=UPI0025F134A0|nr:MULTISPECIES: hypothetical protein [unclassified Sphingobacterium]
MAKQIAAQQAEIDRLQAKLCKGKKTVIKSADDQNQRVRNWIEKQYRDSWEKAKLKYADRIKAIKAHNPNWEPTFELMNEININKNA